MSACPISLFQDSPPRKKIHGLSVWAFFCPKMLIPPHLHRGGGGSNLCTLSPVDRRWNTHKRPRFEGGGGVSHFAQKLTRRHMALRWRSGRRRGNVLPLPCTVSRETVAPMGGGSSCHLGGFLLIFFHCDCRPLAPRPPQILCQQPLQELFITQIRRPSIRICHRLI